LTAEDLKEFGLIDEVVPEPNTWKIGKEGDDAKGSGAAFTKIGSVLRNALLSHLKDLSALSGDELVRQRFTKFRKMGQWI
jgi:acetyl-CoA carboxylase carboxyl transferase subunit alpha